jgi:hypothetical protein
MVTNLKTGDKIIWIDINNNIRIRGKVTYHNDQFIQTVWDNGSQIKYTYDRLLSVMDKTKMDGYLDLDISIIREEKINSLLD